MNPVVTIEMENGGIMKLELYPDVAPISVQNFIDLAEKGFYDGLIFHRVISGFMIMIFAVMPALRSATPSSATATAR